MYVKQIVSIDKHSGEADIIVSDGVFELICYNYQLTKIDINMEVEELSILSVEHIVKADSLDCLIEKLPSYYAYHLQGKVVDTNNSIINIGNLKVNLDKPLPGDIMEDDFVEFNTQRIDCFLKTGKKGFRI